LARIVGEGELSRQETEPAPTAAFEPFSRRALMQRAGVAGAAALLAQLPVLLDAKGLLAEAEAQELDVTRDTLSGLLAFVLPGDDEYSVAQGVSAQGPGAIGAGTLTPFIGALDEFVPASVLGVTTTVPASGGVAALLNDFALQANPGASGGPFLSPFARLTFEEKAEALRLLEADEVLSGAVPELNFVAGILPGFVAFMACSEVGVLDPETRELSSRPVAWRLSRYAGPAEGHPELRGYYQGRRRVRG
jgi:hypothetical protein